MLKKLNVLLLTILIVLITGCSNETRYIKDLEYTIDKDWECMTTKNFIVCNKNKNTAFQISTSNSYNSVESYYVETELTWKKFNGYNFDSLKDVNVLDKKGLNWEFTIKKEKNKKMKYNHYIFEYNDTIYDFQYYGYTKDYNKYLKDFKKVIKSIKVK